MALRIYNTLSQQKEIFIPLNPPYVGLYVCGITVYDDCHIGHARTVVAFDMIYRYLKFKKYDVTFLRNITDVDDKIIRRAQENHESIGDLTQRYIQRMHEDFDALGILRPTQEPCATHFITEMVALVQKLIEKGHAYRADNGDIFYSVRSFPEYGKLSHRSLDDLQAGARVELNTQKQDPLDFVLWKAAAKDELGWDTELGRGRPGWHIECSAMSMQTLGESFDIHGGGFDLPFPHHENEIAQSEGASGKTFAKYWMHVGFITIKDEKMSKSLNNFLTIRDALQSVDAEILRFFLLSSHYRSGLNYSMDQLQQAGAALERLYNALRGMTPSTPLPEADPLCLHFFEAMDDDFNTPEALAVLFEMAKEIHLRKVDDLAFAQQCAASLIECGQILGLFNQSPEAFFKKNRVGTQSQLADEAIEALIAQRTQARQDKNFALSDSIRAELAEQGVILEDIQGQTQWRRKS